MAQPMPAPPHCRGPRLIVTRPEPEASRWVLALQAQGQRAQALPLIRTEPLPREAQAEAGPAQVLMFVSGAAVRAFFGAHPQAWRPPTRCWCTGPGTAAALREAGVQASFIDSPPPEAAQFDSEALWARVRPQLQPGLRVCIVRGGDAQGRPTGRDWLAGELGSAGAQVSTVVAYRRLPPQVDAPWLACVREHVQARDVWLFSSSEAVAHLGDAVAGIDGLDWGACTALTTHARIAEAARLLGFGRVLHSAPLLPSVLAVMQSLRTPSDPAAS
ncbi:uroporphyrinogen-III synthase [Xenophilus arseniciresistens]|uniref:Uroporphyrinogen-III synthase n=1 Tax=Xenophilus arseniciresistens TaxID=1283306 RepID=A0AAE3N4M7_9BURK|nr:uroporphyrinogen-III synthase [Xenophilus arseniciresistens]MDA7415156.1 uroporphyrinogen-III synthase [Xenophilus arseniciresistens]